MISWVKTYPDNWAASDVTAAPVIVLLGGLYDGRERVGSVAVRLHAPLIITGEPEAELEIEEVPSPTSGVIVGYMRVTRNPELAAVLEVLFLFGKGTRTLLETPAFPVPVPTAAMVWSVETALQRKHKLVVPEPGNVRRINLPLCTAPLLYDRRRAMYMKKRERNEKER